MLLAAAHTASARRGPVCRELRTPTSRTPCYGPGCLMQSSQDHRRLVPALCTRRLQTTHLCYHIPQVGCLARLAVSNGSHYLPDSSAAFRPQQPSSTPNCSHCAGVTVPCSSAPQATVVGLADLARHQIQPDVLLPPGQPSSLPQRAASGQTSCAVLAAMSPATSLPHALPAAPGTVVDSAMDFGQDAEAAQPPLLQPDLQPPVGAQAPEAARVRAADRESRRPAAEAAHPDSQHSRDAAQMAQAAIEQPTPPAPEAAAAQLQASEPLDNVLLVIQQRPQLQSPLAHLAGMPSPTKPSHSTASSTEQQQQQEQQQQEASQLADTAARFPVPHLAGWQAAWQSQAAAQHSPIALDAGAAARTAPQPASAAEATALRQPAAEAAPAAEPSAESVHPLVPMSDLHMDLQGLPEPSSQPWSAQPAAAQPPASQHLLQVGQALPWLSPSPSAVSLASADSQAGAEQQLSCPAAAECLPTMSAEQPASAAADQPEGPADRHLLQVGQDLPWLASSPSAGSLSSADSQVDGDVPHCASAADELPDLQPPMHSAAAESAEPTPAPAAADRHLLQIGQALPWLSPSPSAVSLVSAADSQTAAVHAQPQEPVSDAPLDFRSFPLASTSSSSSSHPHTAGLDADQLAPTGASFHAMSLLSSVCSSILSCSGLISYACRRASQQASDAARPGPALAAEPLPLCCVPCLSRRPGRGC